MIPRLEDNLAFLGAGIIAGVWMERLVSIGAAAPEQIMACDVLAERLEELRQRLGVHTSLKNSDGANFGRMVVIAVPPADVLPLVREIRHAFRPEHLVISLAAGVSVAGLEQALGVVPAVRVMSNTPSRVGEGMNLVAYGRGVAAEERARVERLLDVLGSWFEVPDEQMDYWCALCAVGPTYIFPIVEALVSAAAARGLPAEKALAAAAQVVAGAGRIIQQSGQSPAALKQMISLRTLREGEAQRLFVEAYDQAVAKLQGLAQRLAA